MNINIVSLKMVKENTVSYDARQNITSPDTAYKLAQSIEMEEKAEEEFWILCLDTKNKPCGLHMVSRGSLNSSMVHPREVFKRALLNNACSIMLMHNHPSGNPNPSQADIDITNRLIESGELLGITVLDHIIVGENDYVSFKAKCLM